MTEDVYEEKDVIVPKDPVGFALTYFLKVGKEAIRERGVFTVALSGGSTPKALYGLLKDKKQELDWSKVLVFFSDERSVPETDPDNNYHMAMTSGFSSLPIPKEQIFRMKAEVNIKENALAYEKLIKTHVPEESFDLILLGMGDDGHTASLFPGTKALEETSRLVMENDVPQKNTMRMTFTYPLLHKARGVMFLATGSGKAEMIKKVFSDTENKYPSSKVTAKDSKALWVLDKESSALL